MKLILIFLILLKISCSVSDNRELMSESVLRGLLDVMTIPQLKAISFEVDVYLADNYNRIIAIMPFYNTKIEYIDSIISKISESPELYYITNFGKILEKISTVIDQ